MKKKFLLYVVVIVTCLFLGFTVYYLAKNDENISLNIDNEQVTYINVNDTIAWPIVWTKPYKDTKLSVVVSNESVLSYDKETKVFTGVGGGYTNVTITPSNKNFGPFVFDVYVGNGEQGSPFVIKSAELLAKIGNEYEYPSDKFYTLSNDIDLKTFNDGKWAPLPEFSGNFNGNGHTIYNLNIVDSNFAGLFSKISSVGKVENVKFERVSISGSYDYVGAVAGVNYGFIGKVEVIGSITNTKVIQINGEAHTGAIVGLNEYTQTPAYINMCSAKVSINSQGYAGGLVGENIASIILNSRAIISEYNSSNLYLFGGLVGVNQSKYETETFYPALIAKSYSIIESCLATENVGIVVGSDIENKTINTLYTNKYQDVIFAEYEGIDAFWSVYENEDAVSMNNLIEYFSSETIITSTKTALTSIDTYVNYNFDSVWTIASNDYANINFLGTYETIIIKGVGDEYSSTEGGYTLLEFIEEMKNKSGNTSTYYVTQDTEIDLQNAEWTTISKDAASPFTASIIVEDGVKCVIKNFKLSGDNSSFFGHISGNTIIESLTFENVIVNNTSSNKVAVVATSLTNGATLNKITVNTANVTTNADYTSIICAENQSSVTNSNANNVSMNVSAKTGILRNIGGIVAYNSGLISSSTVNNFTLQINLNNSNGNFNIGGIVGLTESSISKCGVNVFTLDTSNDGSMNVGGVVGYALPKNGDINQPISIDKSYAKATISLSSSNENAYVGGVVATIASGVSVTNSAYKSGTLRSYMVAGIVVLNNGSVSTSYSEGSLKGSYVGGLTVVCMGSLKNCYTLSKLSGIDKGSIVAGVTTTMGPDCDIDKIFSSAKFEGAGSHYAETQSVFRLSTIGKWLRSIKGDVDFGSIKNLVIINYGDATVQKSSIFGGKSGWIDANEDDCKGKDGYAVLKEKAGFDSSVWNFGNNGSYPTLKDAVVVE